MIFHAPHTNAGATALIVRRSLFSRATIVAIGAVVSTTVVLAGRGPDTTADNVVNNAQTSKSSFISGDFGFPNGKTQDIVGNVLAPRAAAPDPLITPLPKDFPLVEALANDGTAPRANIVPDFVRLHTLQDDFAADLKLLDDAAGAKIPKPRNLEVASLSVPDADWSPLQSAVSSLNPKVRPTANVPSLARPETTDSVPEINHLEVGPVVSSFTATDGETLEAMLLRANLDEHDRKATLIALRADNITDALFAGDIIDIAFLSKDDNQLLAIRLRQSGESPVELRWDGDTDPLWASLDASESVLKQDQMPVITEQIPEAETLSVTGRKDDTVLIEGEIASSLYSSAAKAGLTAGETKALSNIFRYSVDFERDLRKGDHFEALFEKKPNGAYGNILYAKLTNRGSEIALYRGVDDVTGEVGYFDATGKTNKRSLMRTPVARAEISSHFGMRHHPILGYNKMHRGTDFRARRGTPIFAAGDGIIDSIGRKGAYGKYIRIRHNSTYETAYAHMSGYAAGLNYGDRVRQGDVIGYVGTTGRSTGPHLHFEILKDGNQINPLKLADFGPVRGLSGAALSAFLVRVSRIEIALTLMRKDSAFATAQ